MAEQQSPFAIVPVDAALDHRLTAMQYRILIAILSFRNRNSDTCYPRREKLAERTGYSITNVSRVTAQLVELGWLKKTGKGGRSSPTHYRVTVPETVANPETVAGSATVATPDNKTVAGSVTKTVAGSATGKEQTKEQTKEHKDHSLFERWYQHYPRKVAKGQARKAFAKLNPDEGMVDRMIEAVEAQKRERVQAKAAGEWVSEWKHPATWINAESWEDEVGGGGEPPDWMREAI